MKSFDQFVRHIENQDNGTDLVESLNRHIEHFDNQLAQRGQITAGGFTYNDKDWVDEFMESDKAAPVYRYLVKLAKDPERDGVVGLLLSDFRDQWLCELAALDAQYDHDAEV